MSRNANPTSPCKKMGWAFTASYSRAKIEGDTMILCPFVKSRLSKIRSDGKHGHAPAAVYKSLNIGKGDDINGF